jgi:hypothetical protein
MSHVPLRGALRASLLVAAMTAAGRPALAQTPVESSVETRFQLDLAVPDAALRAYLPAGFTPNVATQGAAKDCNLRLVFIDRLTVNAPDGKPLGKGTSRLVYLVAPVKDPSGANAQLVIGGLTDDAADAPGPFGNYLPATTHVMKRTTTAGGLDTQDWVFVAASGERLEMHITLERGIGNRGNPSETKFYSAKSPATYQISRQSQVLDISRNTTTNPRDKVKKFSLKMGGGSWTALLGGPQKVLSWDNIVWIDRTVLQP